MKSPWARSWIGRLLALDAMFLFALILWVAYHAVPSTEAVRIRNALSFDGVMSPSQMNWTPDATPRDFRTESRPVPKFFADVIQELNLSKDADDWSRAIAIAHHLQSRLGTSKGPIHGDLKETYHRIVTEGAGYCGDYAMTFTALANAAGIPNRVWSFSFDGYGGHGHIFNEVWDSASGQWRAIDTFNNYLFVDAIKGEPLSALDFRASMRGEGAPAAIVTLNQNIRPGFKFHEKAIDYYLRGANQWYQPWGNDVFTVDEHQLVQLSRPISRHLESLASILANVRPTLRIVETPESLAAIETISYLKTQLLVAAVMIFVLGLVAIVLLIIQFRLSTKPVFAENSAEYDSPAIVVLSTLFPSPALPQAGIFIRERMFKVARLLPLSVVSPYPWFPLQGLLRCWRPYFRPHTPDYETQSGIDIFRPRFFCFPGVLKNLDGILLALFCYPTLRRLKHQGRLDILDAHFAYPDGYAAVRLGRWLDVPVCVTLRGTETRQAKDPVLAPLLAYTLKHADRVFSVAQALLDLAVTLGLDKTKATVIGNGVDSERFHPIDRTAARLDLKLPSNAEIMISVGGLVERKGYHRVIEQIPILIQAHPNLHYLIVGGNGPEGDYSAQLHAQIKTLGLESRVHFLGPMKPEALSLPLSASDIFVLATRNEGWANVFLEAMACGLPVITTDVGGNREVVVSDYLGKIVPFGDGRQLATAIDKALNTKWNSEAIRSYAQSNSWTTRVSVLVSEFRSLAQKNNSPAYRSTAG